MPKHVLILMSDTGGGHRAAAEAIRDALYEKYGDQVNVSLVDVFRSYSPFPFKNLPEIYPWLINHSKSSWGMGYKLSNSRSNARAMSGGMYVTMESRLKRMLREHPADVIVSVHSVLTGPCVRAVNKRPERPPFITVVTDLVSTHYFWYDRRVDLTLAPTQPAFDRGLEAGIPAEKMRITGLPVHPNFAKRLVSKEEARESLGWDPDKPALLLVGGGDGMGPLYKTARAIDQLNLPIQMHIIAGRNTALKEQIEQTQWNQDTRAYGFVTDMPRMMAAADVLVTKAGPATITEACIAGLPMIIYDAIPGQETGNVEYVVQNNAGVFAPSPREVASAVKSWMREGSDHLLKLSENAKRVARPDAVWDIADEVWRQAQRPLIKRERRNIFKDNPVSARAQELTQEIIKYL